MKLGQGGQKGCCCLLLGVVIMVQNRLWRCNTVADQWQSVDQGGQTAQAGEQCLEEEEEEEEE